MKVDGVDIEKFEKMLEGLKKLKTKLYRHPTEPLFVQTGEGRASLIRNCKNHMSKNIELIPMTGRELSEYYKDIVIENILGKDKGSKINNSYCESNGRLVSDKQVWSEGRRPKKEISDEV